MKSYLLFLALVGMVGCGYGQTSATQKAPEPITTIDPVTQPVLHCPDDWRVEVWHKAFCPDCATFGINQLTIPQGHPAEYGPYSPPIAVTIDDTATDREHPNRCVPNTVVKEGIHQKCPDKGCDEVYRDATYLRPYQGTESVLSYGPPPCKRGDTKRRLKGFDGKYFYTCKPKAKKRYAMDDGDNYREFEVHEQPDLPTPDKAAPPVAMPNYIDYREFVVDYKSQWSVTINEVTGHTTISDPKHELRCDYGGPLEPYASSALFTITCWKSVEKAK